MKVRVKTFEVEHGVVVRSQARLAPMVLYVLGFTAAAKAGKSMIHLSLRIKW